MSGRATQTAWRWLLGMGFALACGRAPEPPAAPVEPPPPPAPVRWLVAPITLGEPVPIAGTGARFRPAAGWFQAEGRLEWVSGDPESGASLSLEVCESLVPVGELAARADAYAEQVHEALRAESGGASGLEAFERVLLGGAPRVALLATQGEGAAAARSLQLAYDTGAHLILATWSAPAERFSEQVDAFRASALTFEEP